MQNYKITLGQIVAISGIVPILWLAPKSLATSVDSADAATTSLLRRNQSALEIYPVDFDTSQVVTYKATRHFSPSIATLVIPSTPEPNEKTIACSIYGHRCASTTLTKGAIGLLERRCHTSDPANRLLLTISVISSPTLAGRDTQMSSWEAGTVALHFRISAVSSGTFRCCAQAPKAGRLGRIQRLLIPTDRAILIA